MARTITRWDPFAELAELRPRFDRLLAEFGDREREWTPAADVVREDDKVVVRVDVPGIKPDEMEIQADNGMLTISGKHEETKEEKDKQYLRRERRVGSFSRTMPLPEGVDAEQIEAKTHDGVLEVTIPLPAQGKKEPVTIKPKAAE